MPGACAQSTPEFRAFWADAFHAGFRSSSEVSQLVSDLRAAHCNAVFVEVRKRGDAYYASRFEPWATDISPAGYDPLGDLLAKAHDTNAGPRIEVHAWIVTYPIWGSATTPPSQTNHPYTLHPDWLSQDKDGNQFASAYYLLDPGHPEVQEHTFNVALDIVTRYDVDGLNFDYIRYPSYNWGYNPVAVARFNARFGRTGAPAPQDARWMQWRRDQVTALLRKVYLSAIAAKPHVKISADTITWAPSVTTDAAWTNSARAYNEVLQDWRSWMEEGLLDLNVTMSYFRQNSTAYAADYLNWKNYAVDRQFNRHVVVGPGLYLNMISNGLHQMRLTREATPSGNVANGVCGYSYAVPASNSIPNLKAEFLQALTQPNAYDAVRPPVFASPVVPPVMPWKTQPTAGHLKGVVRQAFSAVTFDNRTVTATGPTNRTLVTDASGFFGAVDLPPGNYALSVSVAGYPDATANCTVLAGLVTTGDLILVPGVPVFVAHPQSQAVPLGGTATFTATAIGQNPLGYFWRRNGAIVPNSGAAVLTLTNVQPEQAGDYFAVATNAGGFALSSNATLSVILPFLNVAVAPGERTALVAWTTPVPTTSQVEYGLGTNYGSRSIRDATWATTHRAMIAGLMPNTQYCLRALAQVGTNEFASEPVCFRTAGEIIVDNPDASFTGTWTLGTSAAGRYLADYRYATVVAGAATRTATFTPQIGTPGFYDVFAWYPEGSNRSTHAPHTVIHEGGTVTTYLNQQTGGGQWQLLAARKPFAAGTAGGMELSNATGESGVSRVVLADAVRFVYSAGQEFPSDGTVPAWWAQFYFGGSTDSGADPDGDGYATGEEYRFGTDPTNAGSRLEIRLETQPEVRLVFFPHLPDRVYALESRTELDTPEWETRPASPVTLADGQAAFPLPSPQASQAFYRLKANWRQ